MSGKSRHSRKKQSFQNKKGKGSSISRVVATRQQTVAPADEFASPPKVPDRPAPTAVVSAVHYPYILGELRSIGILAGIIVVILVVLALVLH